MNVDRAGVERNPGPAFAAQIFRVKSKVCVAAKAKSMPQLAGAKSRLYRWICWRCRRCGQLKARRR
jgi:hypothetical protein